MGDSKAPRRRISRWADLPPELLMNIFSHIPSWSVVCRVCIGWQRAVLSLPRPVVLCPVPDYPAPDILPFPPVTMQLLVPTFATPQEIVVSRSINDADGPKFSYLTVPTHAIGSEMRLVSASAGIPLFVDEYNGCLLILRLTSQEQPGRAQNETAMILNLPDGVDGEEIYIGSVAVSRTSRDARCLPLGISAILVATKSCIFGTRATGYRQLWSVLHLKEPAEGRSFEQKGVRTFVSILCDGSESAYLLDSSRRLCYVNWNSAGRLQMQELPIQGDLNALLEGGNEALKMIWLLHLPPANQQTRLTCLAYRWFPGFEYGRFVAFDLVEEEGRRQWVNRHNILGQFCVMVGFGPGAAAVVYNTPDKIGLTRGRIYSSESGLRSYVLGWNYRDAVTVHSCWPFPLWINPDFPNPLSLEDVLVKAILDGSATEAPDADADGAEKNEVSDAEAMSQMEPSTTAAGLGMVYANADGDEKDEVSGADAMSQMEASTTAAGLEEVDADADVSEKEDVSDADAMSQMQPSTTAAVLEEVDADADVSEKEDVSDADAMSQMQPSTTAAVHEVVGSSPPAAPAPLLERLLRSTLLQLDSDFY